MLFFVISNNGEVFDYNNENIVYDKEKCLIFFYK